MVVARQEEERNGEDGGKIEWKSSEFIFSMADVTFNSSYTHSRASLRQKLDL